MKTRKALVKKVRITKGRKVIRRTTGQNHFNGKCTGKETRDKRNDQRLYKTDEKNVLKSLSK